MRRTSVLPLLLLAGCTTARAEPQQHPAPVVIRVIPSDGAVGTTLLKAVRMERADDPCETNDPMPVARLETADLRSMPTARPLRPLPYIPNLCPVTVPLAQKPAVPVSGPRGPRRLREPQAEP